MRISADSKSKYYSPAAHRATVYLDGVRRDNVITADEERGHVICYSLDKNGNAILNSQGDDFLFQLISGVVKVDIA